jgi:uncharacterized protein
VLVNVLQQKRWNPYVVGVGLGILSCATFLTMDKALGTSTSFVHVAAMIEGLFAPGHVSGPQAAEYFTKEITPKNPLFDWQLFLVIGVFLGGTISARLSRDRCAETVPGLWAWRFGPSKPLRYGAAFVFGLVMIYGARLAGGCTSGHAISGGLQLAVSSWVFLISFFASGIATAFALFGVQGRDHVSDV